MDRYRSTSDQSRRRIPRVIHMTSKSRCTTERFVDVIDEWRFANYSLFLHDDEAVDKLLYGRPWLEFPGLQQALHCLVSGAAKADIWRGLVLYEYGGVYTDIDNAPAPAFLYGEAITDTDEAWFVIEQLGVLSQYFMAASPRHPLMWLLVQHTIQRLLALPDVDSQYVPVVTGPGALKVAFMEYNGVSPTSEQAKHPNGFLSFQRVHGGVYHGWNNSTVTVVGARHNSSQYIRRAVVRNKENLFEKMGMVHFSRAGGPAKNESCMRRVYHKDELHRGRSSIEPSPPHMVHR